MDDEMRAALSLYAANHNITVSAAARDLIRFGLGITPSSIDRGWREGYRMAVYAVTQAAAEACAALPTSMPYGPSAPGE
jgi:hypothetical protein